MLSNVIAIGVFPLFAIICFLHKYDKGAFEKDFFSKTQTTTLKGIMISAVFFHHFSQMVYAPLIEYVYRTFQFCIATFFLVAGYTTCLSLLKAENPDYKKIWVNRIWRLYQ